MAESPERCECGASPEAVVHVVQRSSALRLTHYRCTSCSREWTVEEQAPDVAEPVSSDEVLDAHAALADPRLRLEDLTKGKA